MPYRNTIRKIVNIILVIAVAGSWFAILFFSFGPLIQNGFGSIKYFTVQSNLLEGLAMRKLHCNIDR